MTSEYKGEETMLQALESKINNLHENLHEWRSLLYWRLINLWNLTWTGYRLLWVNMPSALLSLFRCLLIWLPYQS